MAINVIRHDGDGGEHASHIYDQLCDCALAYWALDDDPFWDKVNMFSPFTTESASTVEEYELPAWVLDELEGDDGWEDDDCWF